MNTKRSQYTRGPWGSAALIEDGLWRIRLHHQYGALAVNTYVLHNEDCCIIIDPGWPWTLDALLQALTQCHIIDHFDHVTAWLYTHCHIDHMGAAALIAQFNDAPHYAHTDLLQHAQRWHAFQDQLADWSSWVSSSFTSPSRESLLHDIHQTQKYGKRRPLLELYGELPLQHIHPLSPDTSLHLGPFDFQILNASGHDPTHLAFWEPSLQSLFCGDVLLPVPTPLSPPMQDDLTAYEETLIALKSRNNPRWILPGHGTHLKGCRLQEAVARSAGFVLDYRHRILHHLHHVPSPVDLYTLALGITPEQQVLSPTTRWWVHLALVDTHLQWLIAHDDVVRVSSDVGPFYWI